MGCRAEKITKWTRLIFFVQKKDTIECWQILVSNVQKGHNEGKTRIIYKAPRREVGKQHH